MKILFGEEQATSGEIFINGEKVHITSPKQAIKMGIGMVHQHFMLVPSLTVVENIILGMEPKDVYKRQVMKKDQSSETLEMNIM